MPNTPQLACRLLHVEDSPHDAELLLAELQRARPGCSVQRVETEEAYCAALDGALPDAILCDYNMPRFSAERALALLRERGLELPFIIISHHIGETAAVVAMQNGASDYLPKGDLRRLGKAIDVAVDRVRARVERARALEALKRSEALTRSVLDSLGSRIAVVDGSGTIVAVNKAWAEEYKSPCGKALPPGGNYLEKLESRAAAGDAYAAEGLEALRSVMRRERSMASVDYQFMGEQGNRWYLARVTPQDGSEDGVVVSHQDITDRMMAHLALDKANRRLQAVSKRVLCVQEDERRAISRELHDDFGQSLTALKIALHRIARDAAAPYREPLSECLAVADATLEKIRELAQQIRPPQLDQLGLSEALESLAERQRIATGLDIRCEFTVANDRRYPAEIETACYRIAQEAINNASRHGNASAITIALEGDGSILRVAIHDDGSGFDVESTRQGAIKTGTLGLIGMEERAALAGGRLKMRSVRGAGTTVTATFPVDPASRRAEAKAA
ncbi:MAG TPA: histidine kinase [Usitatibacter sp.]|nr:histidine kinase [Usitatibacter sp.]